MMHGQLEDDTRSFRFICKNSSQSQIVRFYQTPLPETLVRIGVEIQNLKYFLHDIL